MFGPAARGYFFAYGLAAPACFVAVGLLLLHLDAAGGGVGREMLKAMMIAIVILWIVALAGIGLLVLVDRLSRRRG